MKAWTDEKCRRFIRAAWLAETGVEPPDGDDPVGLAIVHTVVDEARREEREAIRQVISAEASKHPGCCHHLRDAILASDKEPRDAER